MQSCYVWDVCLWFPPSRCLWASFPTPISSLLSTLAAVLLNGYLFKRWTWSRSFWTRELKARWGQVDQGQRTTWWKGWNPTEQLKEAAHNCSWATKREDLLYALPSIPAILVPTRESATTWDRQHFLLAKNDCVKILPHRTLLYKSYQ